MRDGSPAPFMGGAGVCRREPAVDGCLVPEEYCYGGETCYKGRLCAPKKVWGPEEKGVLVFLKIGGAHSHTLFWSARRYFGALKSFRGVLKDLVGPCFPGPRREPLGVVLGAPRSPLRGWF